ncbi:MAG TPA: methyltransferase [Alphaproteobacteria bacterium]|nr:methyltransferase [Alphaproteobacteria bacterium]
MALPEKVTRDALLGGQVTLRQHAAGYRVAMDPVLLAASVPAAPGETVLDVGTGVGAAMLCLAWRVGAIKITGVEVQRELVHLAVENIADNGLSERVEVMVGDLQRPPPRLVSRSFDHVMANPPYFEAGRVRASGKDEKARANIEGSGGLGAWVDYCLSMARPGGSITMIHRADRLAELLALLGGKAGELVIFPLWPHHPFAEDGAATEAEPGGQTPVAAKRVIVQAFAGAKGPLRMAAGLVLHKANGNHTKAADSVLRHGGALML